MSRKKKYCSELQKYGYRIIREAIKNSEFGSSPEEFAQNEWRWIFKKNKKSKKYYWHTHDYQMIIESKDGKSGYEFLANFRVGYTYVAYIEKGRFTIPNIFKPEMTIDEVKNNEEEYEKTQR